MTMAHIKRSFKVSLWITHPNVDPRDISRALSLSPSHQSRAGQQRVTPTGELLDGTYQFSSWVHAFETGSVTDLTEFLPSIIAQIKSNTSYFWDIVNEGGSVELFCGVFADGNWDESFHHLLLRDLVEMAVDLRIDVYPKSGASDGGAK